MPKQDQRPDTSEDEDDGEAGDKRRYRAPALEKGLDVLELIASETEPITLAEIVRRLDRSSGELFRMVQVLEYRGYIARAGGSEGYVLTDALFSMAMRQPAVRDLMEVALPHMRTLSAECGQSSHLARHSGSSIVVVARMESREAVGFSVRVGYRRFLPATVSGTVLYAFQGPSTRADWEADFAEQIKPEELRAFQRRAEQARKNGFHKAPSAYVAGVTDISAPLMRGDHAVAALTMPFVTTTTNRHTLEECVALLKRAAADISAELALGDASV